MQIRKAVIPAAGFGTRFLPATKAVPKEMLSIVDTPVIQYVVEEAVASGITDILMIVSRGKRAIEEHFDGSPELEAELEAKGRAAELATIRRISDLANIHYVPQKKLCGLGDAILYARQHVGNEPFAVLLGDTLLQSHSDRPVTRQLMDLYERHQAPVVALEEVPPEKISRYGIVDGEEVGEGTVRIRGLVEKPAPEEAPSNLAIASRYILTPRTLDLLAEVKPGKNGEIQLTDALCAQAQQEPFYGLRFDGRRHDAGNKLEFLKTNILYALQRPDLRDDVARFLIEKAAELQR